MKDLRQALFLAGESTLLAVVRLGDSRTGECSFNAKVRMNITHVLKRAQSLPFTGGKCLSMNMLSSLLLLVENILQKMVGAVVSRDRKRGKRSTRSPQGEEGKSKQQAEDKGGLLNVASHEVRISVCDSAIMFLCHSDQMRQIK